MSFAEKLARLLVKQVMIDPIKEREDDFELPDGIIWSLDIKSYMKVFIKPKFEFIRYTVPIAYSSN